MDVFKKLFGTSKPIIQAPMAGVQGSELAIAVSNAGGIGSLPCGMLSSAQISQEIETIQSHTSKPFNVNFFCHKALEKNIQQERRWAEILSPYYQEYHLDSLSAKSHTERKAFNLEMAALLEKYRPPIVSFHFGLPKPELFAHVKNFGAKVLSTATTVEEALWLEQHGADVIIVQGLEAGGHRGHFLSDDLDKQMNTSDLLPKVLKAVSRPVVAAGGIADSAAVQKALQLGAAGVQVGTAYLLCPEANTKLLHQKAIQEQYRPTAITNLFSGRPARGIMNRLIQELGPLNPNVPSFPYAPNFIANLRELAEAEGIDDFSPLWCGENRTGCKVLPAAKITDLLMPGI